jgi:1-acyl-sn-glycerol-3-phosphate acyltransferase
VEPVVRLAHRPRLEGLDLLPDDGPFMLVGNHSAAMAAGELLSFAACYLEQQGPERPLAGMAHPFAFSLWPFSTFVRGMGAVPSTYQAAEETLQQGIPVLVFPGGDYEATRPLWRANQVMFAGRKGFVRIARKLSVPIVPLGIRGSHYSVPIVWRSRLLPWLAIVPRLLGIKRFPVTLLGATGAVAIGWLAGPRLGWPVAALLTWAWLASPLPLLPWVPSTIRMRVGTPISPQELFGNGGDDELDGAYDRVQTAVQQLVAALGQPTRNDQRVGP